MTTGLEILSHKLEQTLALRREQGRLIDPPSPLTVKDMVDFSSNDSLSLSSSGALTKAFLEELKLHPNFTVGSSSSRILDGTKQYLVDLEACMADFYNAEAAMFFNSGFDANVAIWSTIPQLGDYVAYDEYAHASIHDGMRRSRAKLVGFKHNDCGAFETCLEKIKQENTGIVEGTQVVFVALESFYSMDGDAVKVTELLDVAHKALPLKNFIFSMDEAHSTGLVGPKGSGFVRHYGLETHFPIRLQTYGKGMGSNGAVVLCNEAIKSTIINYARGVIFTTAPSFVTAAAVRAGQELVAGDEGERRRRHLQENVRHFFRKLTSHTLWPQIKSNGVLYLPTEETWNTEPFQSPIVAVIPQAGLAADLGNFLAEVKYRVNVVHYPIVPKGKDRIRIVIHADNAVEQIDRVVELIVEWAAIQMRKNSEPEKH